MIRRLMFCLVLLASTAAAAPSAVAAEGGDFKAYATRPELAQDHADVFRLYWAFFDREPDVAGATYWTGRYDRCASLLDITWSFSNSKEFRTRYGNLSNEAYVDLVYANVLDRRPDAAGRRYWTRLLDSGELIQPEVMLYFSVGQEFRDRHPLPSDGRPYGGCRDPLSPPAVIPPGTYLVGSEVPPGVYRVVRYWATLDEDNDILDNEFVLDNGLALAVVTSKATSVQFAGEAVGLRDRPNVDPLGLGFTEGTYLVGADLQPGRYRVRSADDLAYAARLDANLGIIDNALNQGSVILTIGPSDYAFTFRGTLEKLND
ncbi:MAG: DUF4214 domain-containing protein [Acidimicrobiia bacterium]|nr:DUF4214 domain-containing protein [Acidimicrobiia bacterium]